jgi:hypothetical protein
MSWLFQSQWVSPEPELVTVVVVAAVLMLAQRTIVPARALDPASA